MIGWENYEEYMMMLADGELSAEEERELTRFVAANPQLQSELAAYTATRVQPDEAIVYPDKKGLLKQAGGKRVIYIPVWAKYGIAAALGIFVVASFYDRVVRQVTSPSLAGKSEMKQSRSFHDTVRTKVSLVNKNIVRASPNTTMQVATIIHSVTKRIVKSTKERKVAKTETNVLVDATSKNPRESREDNISLLPAEGMHPLKNEDTQKPIAEVNTLTPPVAENREAGKRSFWDWLPMEDEKKQHLQDMAAVITDIYEGKSDPVSNNSNKRVNVKIENRKIKLSF